MFKRYWWMLLVMAPVGMMAGLMLAAVVTYVMPKKYESFATIEIKPRQRQAIEVAASPQSGGMTEIVCGTEFEKIKSRNSLSKVIDSLDLMNRWGLDRETALQILKGIVQTENIRGTDLIQIRVRHTNKEDARDIAAEVARAYKEYRQELESKSLERGISEFKRAVREQEDRVEERRKLLTTIGRSKSPSADSSLANQEVMQLESQIKSLLKYENEQLLIYASGLNIPDNIIKSLYPEYLDLKRQIEGLKASGTADDDPTVVSMKNNLAAMKNDLDEGVVNLRTRLQLQLEMAKMPLTGTFLKEREPNQEVADAKRDFEIELSLLEQLKIKLITQEISQGLSDETIVIHDDPVIADSPVSPNVTLNLVAGTFGGLLLSPFLALPLMWWMNRRSSRAVQAAGGF